jgi:FAD dependent oxidoreductase
VGGVGPTAAHAAYMIVNHYRHRAEAVPGRRWPDGCGGRRQPAASHGAHVVRQRSCSRLPACRSCAHSGSADVTVDVVVVGAGIVGLSTAATLLRQQDPPLSVAVVDRKVPCAGATGAGGSQCNHSWPACCLHRDAEERTCALPPAFDACCWYPRPGLHMAGAPEHWGCRLGAGQAQQGTLASDVGRAAPGFNLLAGITVAGGYVDCT